MASFSDDPDACAVPATARERAAVDASLRQPVLVFIGSALAWLLVATALRWLASVEAVCPACFADLAWLSYGRIEAASRMAGFFGWASLGGTGAALWIVARLGATPAPGWIRRIAVIAAAAWNAALLAGILGILCGGASGIEALELPPRALGVIFAAQLLLACCGVALFAARHFGSGYVSQTYLLAALVWFPAILALGDFAGSMQPAGQAWSGDALFSLWLLPIGLGILYYLLPKLLGRPVASGAVARLGFWSFALIAGWIGSARLTGGTAPAWVASAGIAAHIAMLVPVLAVALNLVPLLAGRLGALALAASPVLRCAAVALATFIALYVEQFLTAFRSVGDLIRFTYWNEARAALGLDLFAAMALFGAIYYIAPRLAGWEWPSLRLMRIHFWGVCLGAALLIGAMTMGGLIEGLGLADPHVPFAAIVSTTLPFLWLRSAALLILLAAHAAFALHFVQLLRRTGPQRTGPTLFAASPHVPAP